MTPNPLIEDYEVKKSSNYTRKHTRFISCLFFFAAYFLLLPLHTKTQFGPTSFVQLLSSRLLRQASFVYKPVYPAVGQNLQSKDTSKNTLSSSQRAFGDGVKSNSQNPNHVYAAQGAYSVTLASGPASASINRTSNIGSGKAYWVSPIGTATWPLAYSATPLIGTACSSLATACANASAGNTVYLRGGTYDDMIYPVNSGTASAKITFIAYPGETPVISNVSNTSQWYNFGICLYGVSYIIVDGMDVENPTARIKANFGRPCTLAKGASYNEIRNCIFNGNATPTLGAFIQWWRGDQSNSPIVHNWLHNCTIKNLGYMYWTGTVVASSIGMQIGVPAYDSASVHNTVENCVFYFNGHHNLEVYAPYCVVKNNCWHNEGCMPNATGHLTKYGPDTVPPAASYPLWGHRNVQIYDNGDVTYFYNLWEGNRFGPSGPPGENDGGDGLIIVAPYNIIRYNYIFYAQNNGVLFKTGGAAPEAADNNRFYNNTIYWSGRNNNIAWNPTVDTWQGYSMRWYGTYVRNGNVIINNIMYKHGGTVDINTNTGVNRIEKNWMTANGDPLFINPDISNTFSTTLPNLGIRSNSPCVGAGEALTTANEAGSQSTTLVVSDAMFFQDGTWGSALTHGVTLFPDWIAIGTVNNIVQISSINYFTNTITLTSPMTWSKRASIWLYSDSSGRRVLYGTAPDIGAYPVVR